MSNGWGLESFSFSYTRENSGKWCLMPRSHVFLFIPGEKFMGDCQKDLLNYKWGCRRLYGQYDPVIQDLALQPGFQ